jgi:3-deoxy-D-manno-octulosonate 8-phosphate phosphatase (KDO 8-P phosphatase)
MGGMNPIAQNLKDRLLKIKVVLIDNDGVLTDGRIVYGDYGDELKFFDVQDGFGMTLLKRAGFPIEP